MCSLRPCKALQACSTACDRVNVLHQAPRKASEIRRAEDVRLKAFIKGFARPNQLCDWTSAFGSCLNPADASAARYTPSFGLVWRSNLFMLSKFHLGDRRTDACRRISNSVYADWRVG